MLRTVIISSSSSKYMLRFKSFKSDRKSAHANLVSPKLLKFNRNLLNFGPDLSLLEKSVH